MCCSRPATAPPACRISAPSARSCAPPWCARPSSRLSDLPTRLFASPTTWTGCARCRTTCPNQEMLRQHLGKPLTAHSRSVRQVRELRPAQQRHAARASSTASASSTSSRARPTGTERAASTRRCCDVLEHYDEIMEVMLPTLRRGAPATYSPFLPISPKTGRVLQVPIVERDARAGTDRLSRRGRHAGRGAGHRRPLQAAVEARLGHALVRARRRLRDVRQGSDPLGRARAQDLPHPRRPAAGGLQLRALPRRARARRSRSPRATASASRSGWATRRRRAWRCSCIRSRGAAKRLYFDVIPRAVDDYLTFLEKYPAEDAGAAARESRSGTSMTASRPRAGCR